MGITMVSAERLLVSRWCLAGSGPVLYEKGKSRRGGKGNERGSGRDRWAIVTDLVFSPRGVGRAWAVKNIPLFSSTKPGYIPKRSSFLVRRSVSTLVSFLVFDILSNLPPPDPKMFDRAIIPFFRRLGHVTMPELGLKLASTVVFWVSTFCIVNVIHGVLGLLFVGIGVSEAKRWPPVFGDVGEAWSVRRFWG